jgi:hypothetical protein
MYIPITIVIVFITGAVFFVLGTRVGFTPTESVTVEQKAGNTEETEKVITDTETVQKDSSDDSIFPNFNTDTTLNLSGKGLTKAPSSIFDKTNLTVLDLSSNKINGALQAEVRHLQHLRVLNLSHNNFTGVPAEIGQLQNLEILNLSYNALTGLPYELGNLGNLRTLDLRGNTYATADLDRIKQSLPSRVEILVD